jgi:DNA polymerase
MIVDRDKAARELIAFYHEAGVDAVIGEEPIDRLAEDRALTLQGPDEDSPQPTATVGVRERTAVAAPSSRTRVEPPQAPAAPEAAVMAAREAARSAANLDDLRAILDRFEGCALRATATQLVFADGNPQARLMFVGEAPGADEDIQGEPFVGRAGQLLTKIIESIDLKRSDGYLANVLKCRPPNNRNPEPDEVSTCEPFLNRQIDAIRPKVIVALGTFAAQALLKTDTPISRLRGRVHDFRGGIMLVPTFHPAFLLRSPDRKRDVWEDMKKVRDLLAGSD